MPVRLFQNSGHGPEPPGRTAAKISLVDRPRTTPPCRSDAERGTIGVGRTGNQCGRDGEILADGPYWQRWGVL